MAPSSLPSAARLKAQHFIDCTMSSLDISCHAFSIYSTMDLLNGLFRFKSRVCIHFVHPPLVFSGGLLFEMDFFEEYVREGVCGPLPQDNSLKVAP